MTRRFSIICFLFLLSLSIQAQNINNFRRKVIALNADTISIDSLSIIPKSFKVKSIAGQYIDTSLFKTLFAQAKFIPSHNLKSLFSEVTVEYRVFPLKFDREYNQRKYSKSLSPDSLLGREAPRYVPSPSYDSYWGEQIETQGSIMRGIRVGNNQNLSVNSTMNLTLKGELANGLAVEGAISDQSIPLQPEGTTRRLEEFDRIYLKVSRDNFAIQAGDILIRTNNEADLLKFSRSVQGLSYQGLVKSKTDTLIVNAALAVPKGKFAQNRIQGQEGNQGPYRLQGLSGEPFIIIISNSERVFVDGIQLQRGEDGHYIIDYNAAEIRFTQRMPINRNSRIQVEFEYSERSFARFNSYASVQNSARNWLWHFSVFSESDSRNQPFDQELNAEQRKLLAAIGDNLNLAFIPQADRVDFDPEKILYQKIDTVLNGTTYSIFKHSINTSQNLYRVYFSFVGNGNGTYQPKFGGANGRVYIWVAPEGGKKMGSYEPVKRLVAPQKRQMIQAGTTRKWGEKLNIAANYALSNTDLNTFSDIDSDDNIGQGIELLYHQKFNFGNCSMLLFGAKFRGTSSSFRSIDRNRPVEFERNWSILNPLNGANEQHFETWTELNNKTIYTTLKAERLSVSKWYRGNRASTLGTVKGRLFTASWDGSWVNATDTLLNTQFIKAKTEIRSIKGFFKFRFQGEVENSISKTVENQHIQPQSFSFYQIKIASTSPDSLRSKAEVTYTLRTDFKPSNNIMATYGQSQEVTLNAINSSRKAGNLAASIGYRLYEPNKAIFAGAGKLERTALARLEYSNRLLKGLWMVTGGYELGSGLEPDAEFYFIEVSAGQGVFTWVDYNGNGIKELHEFEIANYPDEARFIRINIPGAKLINVRNNSLSVRSVINASSVLQSKTRLAKFIRRFSNQTSYRIQQKNRYADFWQTANPINNNLIDTLITSLSMNLRNSLAFNRSNNRFGFDYTVLQGQSKTLLANGFELRELLSHRVSFWLGVSTKTKTVFDVEIFENKSTSQYFTSRNYWLSGANAQQSVKYLFSNQSNIELGYIWKKSQNTLSDDNLIANSIYTQTDLVFSGKGSVLVKGSLVKNNFNGNSNTAAAYEMMKGLQPSLNATWEVSIRRRLSKLFELEVGYNGRYLNGGNTIHSGTMQARALF